MKNGLSKSVFRAQKGCLWVEKRPIWGDFRRYLGMYRVTLSCGFVVENATYQEAWDWLQEDEDCIVEEIREEEECTEK